MHQLHLTSTLQRHNVLDAVGGSVDAVELQSLESEI